MANESDLPEPLEEKVEESSKKSPDATDLNPMEEDNTDANPVKGDNTDANPEKEDNTDANPVEDALNYSGTAKPDEESKEKKEDPLVRLTETLREMNEEINAFVTNAVKGAFQPEPKKVLNDDNPNSEKTTSEEIEMQDLPSSDTSPSLLDNDEKPSHEQVADESPSLDRENSSDPLGAVEEVTEVPLQSMGHGSASTSPLEMAHDDPSFDKFDNSAKQINGQNAPDIAEKGAEVVKDNPELLAGM